MRFNQLPLKEIKLRGRVVEAASPSLLEPKDGLSLAQEVYEFYQAKINPKALELAPPRREVNADTFEILVVDHNPTLFHLIYDLDETRLGMELQDEAEATKVYRWFREQRVIIPDLEYIRARVKGGLEAVVAALLWQVGAIKVSLGDLRPFFWVDERQNRSPIYVDLKGLGNYPTVNDLLLSQAALLLGPVPFDYICGIEAGSIGIAAVLGHILNSPVFFARRERRYPEAALLEGIRPYQLAQKRILLVDDTIVKGWTKQRIIKELRVQGGIVEDCFVILDRAQGGREALSEIGVRLQTLTDMRVALSLEIPAEITLLTPEERQEVSDYFADPKRWHKRHGFSYRELRPK
jgi:orotate phosphoribosyltransferase